MTNTVEHSVHSILSPSKAHMWAYCAGALRMAKGIVRPTTIDAASGTCTHWISEQDLKEIAPVQSQLGKTLTFDGFSFVIDQDRIDRAQKFCEAIRAEPGDRLVEQQLDMSYIYGVEGQEGHGDVITMDPNMVIVHPTTGIPMQGIITAHDLKDGAGLIYARDNPQLLSYGASAMWEHDIIFPWGGLRVCVHQPRMHHYDEWVYSREEVAGFIAAIRPAAKLAWDIYQDVIPLDEDKHLNPGYEQCQWCDVKGSCGKRAAATVAKFAVRDVTEPLKLTDAQVSEYFSHSHEYEDWIRAIRGEAFRRAAARRGAVSGMKIVRGKRGAREFTDLKAALAAIRLVSPVPDDMLFKPPELLSPTAMEKIVGKATLKEVAGDLIAQAPGSLTLVPLHDRREEVVVERQEFAVIDTSDFDLV